MTTRRRSSFARVVGGAMLSIVAVSITIACNGVLGIPEVDHLAPEDDDGAVSVPPPEAGASPVVCAPGQKSCGGVCVSLLEPSTGCAATDCQPCALAHAKNVCVQGACAIEACEEGFGNCNALRADGCEADLRTDNNNCQTCGNKCGDFACNSGVCLCTTNASCRYNGKCLNKTCVCGSGNTCSAGSDCDDYDSCSF